MRAMVCNIDLDVRCKGRVEYGPTASMACDGVPHDGDHFKYLYAADGSGRIIGTATAEQLAAIFKTTEKQNSAKEGGDA